MEGLYGGIEFGGTKTICAVGTGGGDVAHRVTFPTATVDETLGRINGFFNGQPPVRAFGVGAFGPINLNKGSPSYGTVFNTPKSGWSGARLVERLRGQFGVPVVIDLDVACAAMAERAYGAAKGIDHFIYLTFGTGVGGALVYKGRAVHGLVHLEMGHMRIPHEPFTDGFTGTCPFHGDCLEGIASGHALQVRYGRAPKDITGPEAYRLEAGYIAHAIHTLMMTHGPARIVLGGGLISQPGLLDGVRREAARLHNGYLPFPDMTDFIVPSSGTDNGVRGALMLAALGGEGAAGLL